MHTYKLYKDRERLLQLLADAGIPPRILQAMATVPREHFLPPALQHFAYENTALPIGWGQTISQPLTVAKMTALLEPAPSLKVLEIGTGSGYQAAILAALGMEVYSVERQRRLYETAVERFRRLELAIHCAYRDGTMGWPAYAPYDRILLTAATEFPHPDLLGQLGPGGLCVFPLHNENRQYLARLRRNDDGSFSPIERFDPCEFVPLRPSIA